MDKNLQNIPSETVSKVIIFFVVGGLYLILKRNLGNRAKIIKKGDFLSLASQIQNVQLHIYTVNRCISLLHI